MSASAALSTAQSAALLGVSERHARRRIAPGAPVSSLPPDAQLRWAQMNKVVALVPAAPVTGQMGLSLTVPTGPNLSDEDRIEVERRYRVIEPLIARERFASVWINHKNSKLEVLDWLAAQHKISRQTIYNWLARWKEGGLPALVSKDRADKGKPKSFNAAALEFILACAFPKHGQYGKLTVRDIYRAYADEREFRAIHATLPLANDFDLDKYSRYLADGNVINQSAQLPVASYSTFRNWFDKIPDIAKVMARDGEEAFHTSQEILSYRDLSAVQPLDYLVMDHRRLDIFCLIPDGRSGYKLARPWLTAAIDMRTRKWLGWVICASPSSDSIAAVLKRVFLSHGLPAACYWDNGKDFRCEWLEGGKTRESAASVGELDGVFRGVLDTLGIRVHHAIVKRARSKIIEPNFGRTAKFDRTLPWWCGHNPGARPAERFDKLLAQHEAWLAGHASQPAFPTIAQVADLYDKEMNALNERPMEFAEGMNKVRPSGRGWMCPNEAWELLIGRVEKRTIPEEALAMVFAKRRDITIRNGEALVQFGGEKRHYRMQNPLRLMAYNGCEVQFAYDPLDLQTAALYYEGRLLGLVECIELRRMGEDSFVADEMVRRTARREVKNFIRVVHENVHVATARETFERRPVEPRNEPARRTLAAELPPAIVSAIAEAAEDRQSPDPSACPISIAEPEPPAAANSNDDNFSFFS